MIITPLVLIFLPSDFFDYGESICPSNVFFGVECPGCGMTRATMHMMHLDFKAAWHFNWLSFFIIPLLLYYYFSIMRKLIRRVKNGGNPVPEKEAKTE